MIPIRRLLPSLVLAWACDSTPAQPATHTLTLARTGAGAGVIVSTPAGLSCGATCAATFAAGTVVTLTVTPSAGSAFGGWSGGGCSGTGACVVTVNAAVTVTAQLDLQSYTIGGTASGVVGSGCVLQLNGGSNLALSANGAFTFATPVLHGGTYLATVLTQPTGPTQTCVLTGGAGTVAAANVTNLAATCTVDRPACATAEHLGSIAGDAGAGAVSRSGAGERWYRVRLTEQNNGSVYLSATITLTVPAGVDYDVYAYCAACGGSPVALSNNGAGLVDQVGVRWDDDPLEDDSGDVFVQVRYFAGASPQPWTLQITANTTVAVATCDF